MCVCVCVCAEREREGGGGGGEVNRGLLTESRPSTTVKLVGAVNVQLEF